MRQSLAVPTRVKELIGDALPNATMMGLVGDESAPTRVDIGGRVIVRFGDPGDPEIDLSPLSYNYDQRMSVEVAAPSEEALDAMIAAIGVLVEANRIIAGLWDWLDATAPETEDIYVEGGKPPRGANLIVTASYSSPHPLT